LKGIIGTPKLAGEQAVELAHAHSGQRGQALRQMGRIERTLFTLDWINDEDLRKSTTARPIKEKVATI